MRFPKNWEELLRKKASKRQFISAGETVPQDILEKLDRTASTVESRLRELDPEERLEPLEQARPE